MTETTKPAVPKAKAARSGGSAPWGDVQRIKATGSTFEDAAQIESAGAWTVAIVEVARDIEGEDDQQAVILPADAAIGDLVELFVNGYMGRVFTAEGDRFNLTDEDGSLDVGSSAVFRKIEEHVWRFVAGS